MDHNKSNKLLNGRGSSMTLAVTHFWTVLLFVILSVHEGEQSYSSYAPVSRNVRSAVKGQAPENPKLTQQAGKVQSEGPGTLVKKALPIEVPGEAGGKAVTGVPEGVTKGQPPHPSDKDKPKPSDAKDTGESGMESSDNKPVEALSGLSPDAVLRGFYVFIGVGTIVLIYIAIKFVRLRRRRSPQKYGLLSRNEDQEMFPLAADDGEDEEIYNATDHHHTLK